MNEQKLYDAAKDDPYAEAKALSYYLFKETAEELKYRYSIPDKRIKAAAKLAVSRAQTYITARSDPETFSAFLSEYGDGYETVRVKRIPDPDIWKNVGKHIHGVAAKAKEKTAPHDVKAEAAALSNYIFCDIMKNMYAEFEIPKYVAERMNGFALSRAAAYLEAANDEDAFRCFIINALYCAEWETPGPLYDLTRWKEAEKPE